MLGLLMVFKVDCMVCVQRGGVAQLGAVSGDVCGSESGGEGSAFFFGVVMNIQGWLSVGKRGIKFSGSLGFRLLA